MIKQRGNIIAVLDVGTSKISCVVGKFSAEQQLSIIGYGSHIANGMRSGVITDLQAATESILHAIEAAEHSCDVRITNVYVNIGSNNLISHQLSAEIDVTGHEINSKDISKLLFKIADKYKDQNVNMIHSFVYDYALDGNRGIVNPLGMYGGSLSCEANVLTAPSNIIANLSHCLTKCQLEVVDYISSSYAGGLACLSSDEMQIGCVLIEIGSGCSSVSIFANSQMVFTDGIAIGGYHITNDIAKGLSIKYDEAERIKVLYGSAVSTAVDSKEMIELGRDDDNEEMNHVSREMLTEIIRARAEEILELLERKASNAGFSIYGGKIILTGGGAVLNGLKELVNHIFSSKVRLGYHKNIAGFDNEEKNMSFVTVIGMLIHASQSFQLPPKKAIAAGIKIWQWIKDNLS